MGVKALLQKVGWYDYSIHNPFVPKEQQIKNKEYASTYGYFSTHEKRYSDFHPQDDALLVDLKAMLEPPKPTPLLSRMQYAFQRFVRKHSDVRGVALAGRSEEEKAASKRCDEIDKKCVKHWDEIQAANEKRYAEWRMKDTARKISERCTIVLKPSRPNQRH